jgi:hypothetical protein
MSAKIDGKYALAGAYRGSDEFVYDWALRLYSLDRYRGGSIESGIGTRRLISPQFCWSEMRLRNSLWVDVDNLSKNLRLTLASPTAILLRQEFLEGLMFDYNIPHRFQLLPSRFLFIQ